MGLHSLFSCNYLLPVRINFLAGACFLESVRATESKYKACKPKTCGKGPDIGYPFYIRDNGTDYCGYPGFGIHCEKDMPTYRTSHAQYMIQNISYENQSFRLVNLEVLNNSNCPTPHQNYSFDRSSVDFSAYHADLFFFYNCNDTSRINYTTSTVSCSSNPKNKTFVALIHRDEISNQTEIELGCEYFVAAPIQLEREQINQTIKNVDYIKLLTDGFSLKWRKFGFECVECRRSGGNCGFEKENDTSVCYCPDGSRPKNCYNYVLSAEEKNRHHPSCPPFHCGKLGMIKFPFTNTTMPAHCGLITVNGCDNNRNVQKIRLEKNGTWYKVESISQADEIFIEDVVLLKHLRNRDCRIFNNLTFPTLPYISFEIFTKLDLFKCNQTSCDSSGSELSYPGCSNFSICRTGGSENSLRPPPQCSYIQLPSNSSKSSSDIFEQIRAQFSLSVQVLPSCRKCYYRGGQCLIDSKKRFYCSSEGNDKGLKIGLGVGVSAIVIILLSFCTFRSYYKRKKSDFDSAKSHSDPSSKADLEEGSIYFGVPVFSYSELEEATNNFDSEKELGDGGFGTVYYGKLRDGREVAVKRLYEHNYRRLEQFMNEIKILTRLHHKNLVTLYGCTSRRSRELLLVYEYIPNGTVADHLHGDRANSDPLAWPLRLSIAIETAAALTYLHASDIIHRDVKTNNILLDNNFVVKVADFGLSRDFPSDATHVSTAPQGTPGYVDPEYHQCYQLTDKSDVYSFGVVLIELISSMPAVDISRHRHEINLANLAVNKIQNCAFDELVDQHLGYRSDEEVRRTTTSVAELAFRCLQQDKELRPTMDEVLAELKRIESGENEEAKEQQKVDSIVRQQSVPPPSPPYSDEAVPLKNVRLPPSPISVAQRWISSDSTTPNVSS